MWAKLTNRHLKVQQCLSPLYLTCHLPVNLVQKFVFPKFLLQIREKKKKLFPVSPLLTVSLLNTPKATCKAGFGILSEMVWGSPGERLAAVASHTCAHSHTCCMNMLMRTCRFLMHRMCFLCLSSLSTSQQHYERMWGCVIESSQGQEIMMSPHHNNTFILSSNGGHFIPWTVMNDLLTPHKQYGKITRLTS